MKKHLLLPGKSTLAPNQIAMTSYHLCTTNTSRRNEDSTISEYKRLVETCNVHATNSLDKMRNGLHTATVFYKRLASMIAERRDVLSSLRQ